MPFSKKKSVEESLMKAMKQNDIKNTLKMCTDLATSSSDERNCLSILFNADYFWS